MIGLDFFLYKYGYVLSFCDDIYKYVCVYFRKIW